MKRPMSRANISEQMSNEPRRCAAMKGQRPSICACPQCASVPAGAVHCSTHGMLPVAASASAGFTFAAVKAASLQRSTAHPAGTFGSRPLRAPGQLSLAPPHSCPSRECHAVALASSRSAVAHASRHLRRSLTSKAAFRRRPPAIGYDVPALGRENRCIPREPDSARPPLDMRRGRPSRAANAASRPAPLPMLHSQAAGSWHERRAATPI
eukprot:6184465-Prymnesium_polylepis.1